MSTVTVTGSAGASLDTAPVNSTPQSAPVKYGRSPLLDLMLQEKLLALPLAEAASTPVSVEGRIKPAFDFGVDQPQLSILPGAKAEIHVNAKKDSNLFSDNLYKSPVTVKDGEGYLSLALTGSVVGTVSQTKGDITLGFEAGASVTFEYFRKFQVSAASPTVGAALGEVVSNFIMPIDVADLAALTAGDIATCAGKRSLKVKGEFTASVSPVALATPNLPLLGHPVQLSAAAATFDVKGVYEITSSWQIRARAVSKGVIELGLYRQKTSDCDITATAGANVDVTLGTRDLLTGLIKILSKDPAADAKELAAAGLKPDQISAINAAISKSIDHSIHASLSLDLNSLSGDEAAFLYQIEPGKLNGDTTAAVNAALHGDLTLIEGLNPQARPGVTPVRNILTRTKERGVTFKVNFIGLFNFLSLADFISKSQVIHESGSGDVIFSETASGQHIGVISLPQEQEKLRKLMFDSVLMTTTYRSAGALETMGMECSAVHFAQQLKTDPSVVSDYLDWFIAVGLLDGPGKDAIMQAFHGTGKSSCTLRVAFNNDACDALFLFEGAARRLKDYVDLGRKALMSLPHTTSYSRLLLESDTIWNQIDGWTDIARVMQKEKGWALTDPRVEFLSTDYKVVEWWASSMASTADQIVDMRSFLKTADRATLETNKEFLSKKAEVQKHVLGVVKNSPVNFDQPFGLVALDWAAGKAAVASGTLVSPAITREFGTQEKTKTA